MDQLRIGAVYKDKDGKEFEFQGWGDHYLSFFLIVTDERGYKMKTPVCWGGSTKALTFVRYADEIVESELELVSA